MTNDERRARALAMAEQAPEPGPPPAPRTALLGGVIAATLALGIAGVIIRSGDSDLAAPAAGWREVLGGAVIMAGLAGLLIGLAVGVGAGGFTPRRHNPLGVLTRRQRVALLNQVRGRFRADRAALPLLRLMAWRMARLHWAVLVPAGVELVWVGVGVAGYDRGTDAWVLALVVALYGAMSLGLWSDQTRGARFLARQRDVRV